MEIDNDVALKFLSDAYRTAYLFSHDKSTKVGAILVDTKTMRKVAFGANMFVTANHGEDPKNHTRPHKYDMIEHAERTAIYTAALYGECTQGLSLIATWACCPDCARAIVMAGIKDVYTHVKSYYRTPPAWLPKINLGVQILCDAGVGYHLIKGDIGNVPALMNGEVWYP